ncbi:DUF4181 domain-containing protein [Mangrovibacillus sp. Mu-81]|uniref:DUF4181 domain-containing protein n=1 Tax=Mangrovibacillus sp. Mu-81 TaxID=3121478 RepID=UPI002FE497E0
MFWIKFSLIVIVVFALISIVKLILRRIFNIEKVKKDLFSYNHINALHGKIDKWIRITTAVTLIGFSWVLVYNKGIIYLYLFVVVFFLVLDYGVRAFFEWKHSEYPKQAILTLAEMLIMAAAILTVVQVRLIGS